MVDEVVADVVFEELEAKSCPVEAHKGRSTSYFPVEDIHIIHHVHLGIPFNKGHGASSGESRLGILDYVLLRYHNATGLCPSEILVGAQVCEI